MWDLNKLAVSVVATACLLATAPDTSASTERRLALVIGNSSYAEAPLKNPVNDARSMARALRARGFEVIVSENASKQQMENAVADFGEKLTEGATGLFFFAGHGIQVNGRNYLLPVNAKVTSEQRVRLEALDVDAVLDQMQAAKTKVSMVILDACRNNPFERRFRSMGGGLAQINAPEGTMIAYATAPGKVAADGDGANGLYTQELLRALNQPGLKVEDVFKQVRVNVSRASNGMQVPWEASSLTGDFFFVPPSAPASPVATGENPAIEMAFWDAVKNSTNPAEFRAYVTKYPNGNFTPLAQARLEAFSAPTPLPATISKPAQTQPPAPAAQTIRPSPQFAALAPPSTNFNGRYVTPVRGPRANYQATIDVEGTTIAGFATGGAAVCKILGALEEDGTVRSMEMSCLGMQGLSFTWSITGQFVTATEGGYQLKSKMRNTDMGVSDVTWKKN